MAFGQGQQIQVAAGGENQNERWCVARLLIENNYKRLTVRWSLKKMVLSVGKCAACGGRWNLHLDHIVPVCLGGTNEESNLQCLCRRCNGKKNFRLTNDELFAWAARNKPYLDALNQYEWDHRFYGDYDGERYRRPSPEDFGLNWRLP